MAWFDFMENLFHVDMLQGAAIVGDVNNISTALIETSYVFTWLKWLIGISSLGLPLLYIVWTRWIYPFARKYWQDNETAV